MCVLACVSPSLCIGQGEVEQIAMMKPKGQTEHEEGMLEYLEDIIGSCRLKQPIYTLRCRVELLNEQRGEKVRNNPSNKTLVHLLYLKKYIYLYLYIHIHVFPFWNDGFPCGGVLGTCFTVKSVRYVVSWPEWLPLAWHLPLLTRQQIISTHTPQRSLYLG